MPLRAIASIALMCALTAPGMAAEWKRHFANGALAGTWDIPPARPLSYFRVHPCSRSDQEDRIIPCPNQPTAEDLAARAKTRVEIKHAATIGRFRIYDIDYYFARQLIKGPHLRSVLAQTGKDEFHEIYIAELQDPQAVLSPSAVVYMGSLPLLQEHFTNGGMYGNFYEDYFAITDGALAEVNFDAVYDTPGALLPPDKIAWDSTARFDFSNLTWSVLAADAEKGRMGCCTGKVTVRFKIERNQPVVTDSKYEPEDTPRR
jgi:hypothetical protein